MQIQRQEKSTNQNKEREIKIEKQKTERAKQIIAKPAVNLSVHKIQNGFRYALS